MWLKKAPSLNNFGKLFAYSICILGVSSGSYLKMTVSVFPNLGSTLDPKLYIPSTPNNSNETHTFMCLGRTGRFGQR